MSNAVTLIRSAEGYPWEAVNAGLSKSGYQVGRNIASDFDLLVTWTPWRGSLADKLGLKHPNKWLVFENGYIPSIHGKKYYSIGVGGYNGTERLVPFLGRNLDISLESYKHNSDGHILVIGQFGHDDTRYSMPAYWPEDVINRIRLFTNRTIVFRPKMKYRKVRIPKFKGDGIIIDGDASLDEQLDNAHSVVTWNSPSISVKSLLRGIPTFIEAPNCVAKMCSSGDIQNIETPLITDRTLLCDRLSDSIWSIDEIKDGVPFTQLKEYLQ